MAAAPAPHLATAGPPVQGRAPPEGYRRALEAHRAAAPPRQVDPAIAMTVAVEWQIQALRAQRERAFPDDASATDEAPAPIEDA
ncbi:hypothetical protein ACFXP3_00775 [Streptomyces sp. NPDC059096]|uniref:hypothetical protein n=1 Tax=Streptomyces sp. NPDC059096 TaxID=3346727 RepID=UPI0036C60BA8